MLDANPELRRAWRDAQAYREVFATPAEAQAATKLLGDLNRMDALFFSQRPEDHAELARSVAQLDPQAFASLARAMSALTDNVLAQTNNQSGPAQSRAVTTYANPRQADTSRAVENRAADTNPTRTAPPALNSAQSDFFQATNAAAVRGVMEAIEAQVHQLLPEGISKSARNRVAGEIYRELDTTLQALPGVAKRVLNEWTNTVVSANQDRRARQRNAERRVDISGSSGANGGRRAIPSHDIDYGRMTDGDILNL